MVKSFIGFAGKRDKMIVYDTKSIKVVSQNSLCVGYTSLRYLIGDSSGAMGGLQNKWYHI